MSILSTIARATSHTDPNPSAKTEIEIEIEIETEIRRGIETGKETRIETETETEIETAIATGIGIHSCRPPTVTSTFPNAPRDPPS
jgi:hypothetical protein